jgi:hypothetical protein
MSSQTLVAFSFVWQRNMKERCLLSLSQPKPQQTTMHPLMLQSD